MYASLLRISGALHLDIFQQPAIGEFFPEDREVSGVQWCER
jgi:hypothetical protein